MSFNLRASSPVVVNDTDANTTIVISLPNVSVGDGIVIGIAIGNNTSTISSVTISGESNATAIGTLLSVPGGQRNQLYYLPQATGSGTKTITITLSAFAFAASAWAAALDGAIELDDADETASGETLSMTASAANTCVFALGTDGNAKPTVQSGYTGITMLDVASYTQSQYNMDLGASGAKTVTLDGNAFQSIIAAIFKAPASTVTGDLVATESGADTFAATGGVGNAGVRLTLRDTDTGALATSLTGLIVSIRAASNSTSLLASSTSETTDGSGELELASTAIGDVGDWVYVTVEKSDNSIVATYRVQVIDLNA